MSRLGDLILLERTRQKLTRKQVARKCGVSEGYIKDVEEGRRILRESGLNFATAASMSEAAHKIAALTAGSDTAQTAGGTA